MPDKVHILTMTLPIPPSANHSFGIGRGGRFYRTKAATQFLAITEERVKENLPNDWDPETAELEPGEWIIIELHHFDGGRRGGSDLSNRHPLIHNGIKRALGIDDYYYFTRDISREKSPKNPRIVIRIYREKISVVRIQKRSSRRRKTNVVRVRRGRSDR